MRTKLLFIKVDPFLAILFSIIGGCVSKPIIENLIIIIIRLKFLNDKRVFLPLRIGTTNPTRHFIFIGNHIINCLYSACKSYEYKISRQYKRVTLEIVITLKPLSNLVKLRNIFLYPKEIHTVQFKKFE